MSAEDMVDAALAGLDQGEFVTIPALPDAGQWQNYEAARQAMMPNLSRTEPATRYGIVRAARAWTVEDSRTFRRMRQRVDPQWPDSGG